MSLPGIASLKERCLRLWEKGDLLRALYREDSAPVEIPLPRISSRDLLDRFEEVRVWIRSLVAESREGTGEEPFRIVWRSVRHRILGENRLPSALVFADAAACLRFIGRGKEGAHFLAAAKTMVAAFPELESWVLERPLELSSCQDDVDRLLRVLTHFRSRSLSGLYLRQLDIPEVDTKFIERRKSLISSLLDRILPPERIHPGHGGGRGFALRYGLREKPSLVRFRLLDPALSVGGYSDLTVRVSEFSSNPLPVKRVFVVENEINGLAFPEQEKSLLLFGEGYAVDRLFGAGWLGKTEIFYWGDIDTHGLAILDRLRSGFPQARSFLMDREALLSHRELWVEEPAPFEGELTRLELAEQETYATLRSLVRGGRGVRLEQERIPFGRVLEEIRRLA
ncbi:MAG: Wadjet anti-phage system protein JetD domain-containing protein [Leptospirillia bacterium]